VLTIGLAVLTLLGMWILSTVGQSYFPIVEDSVGILRVEGPINESRDVIKVIKRYRENDMIKAIVVRLDTPGGSVGASEEIYRELMRARDKDGKIVIVSMGNAAASGGYYIACAGQRLFANSGSITGSIGVIAPGFNIKKTLSYVGIRPETIKSGEHKDTGSPYDDMTTNERVLIQDVINDMYRQFSTVVLRSRHKAIEKAWKDSAKVQQILNRAGTKIAADSLEWSGYTTGTVAAAAGATTASETALREMADGRVYTGDQALALGLVDEIGTLEDAIEYAGKQTGLGDDPNVVDRAPASDLPSWLGMSARRFFREALGTESSIEMRREF